MKKSMIKKGLVLAIFVLFVGTSVPLSISSSIAKNNIENNQLKVAKNIIQIREKQGGSTRGNDWWPMFHHDLNHSGCSTSDAPDTNKVEWTFGTEDELFFSSPAVYNDKVYIGSFYGIFYCLDANNGSMIWVFYTGAALDSSPAVYNGKVYFGARYENMTYCLDADNGSMIWSYTIESGIYYSSPAVYNDKVYIGSFGGKLYCLGADNGSMIWNHTIGSGIFSSPAISDGKVYIGSYYDNKMVCLNADNGSMIWNYTTGNYVLSSPAVVNGKVYIGSGDNKVYCMDADNGSIIWDYTTGDRVYSSPAVCNSKVYFGSHDSKLYCLYADNGSIIWNYQTGDEIRSSPAIADGKVYFGSEDNNAYCLDENNGSLIWNYTTGRPVDSSPAICNGKVYIGSNDGKVYCFVNQPPETPSDPDPQNGATNIYADIKLRWTSGDPDDNDTVYYDIYLGTDQDPPFKERIGPYPANLTRITYDPELLKYSTHYYWKIIADDKWKTSEGPIWNFTTYLYPPNANFTYNPINPTNEDIIQFNDTSTDPDGTIVKWFWNFGDHYLSDLQNPIHRYYKSGSYNASLTVMDNYGANDTYGIVINISDAVGLITELQKKWNIIGLPYNTYLVKEDVIIRNNSINYTWQEAVDEDIILDFIYSWNRTSQTYIISDTFNPGYGYWMYAYYDCILLRPTN